ncbi:TIGR02710 family CRISPR-associated CARF protein [Myxococcota bacterium]|nr:TIGR02710 family CRISPR-associated CARF protein [Myxococcota bacterium]
MTNQTPLQEKTAEWKRLAEEGKGSVDEATAFYDREVFPLVRTHFIEDAEAKGIHPVDALILPVGTSPEPIILSILALKPQRVMFLPTPQTRQHLDRIIAETQLKPSQYQDKTIDGSDVLEIYRCMHQAVREWPIATKIGVDITAGKKVMSAACAIAGTLIEMRIFYVDSDYLPKLRRPEPGTEYLSELPNPLVVFGDIEEREARKLYAAADYAGAAKLWEHLAIRIQNPTAPALFSFLARTYEAWDQLHYANALASIQKLNQSVRQFGKDAPVFFQSHKDRLFKQQRLLERMAHSVDEMGKETALDLQILQQKDAIHALILELWAYAQRKIHLRDLSTASLLLYRTAELLAQRRLALYGIDPSLADYAQPGIDPQALLDAVNAQRVSFKFERLQELPIKIAMLDAYVLLIALNDPYAAPLAEKQYSGLQRFNGIIKARNSSIFAHGFKFVADEHVRKMRAEVEARLLDFFRVEGVSDPEIQAQQQEHCFLTLE